MTATRDEAELRTTSKQQRDRMVAAYARSSRWRSRWRRLADGVFDGLWLGLLSPRQLRLVDQNFYAQATEEVNGTRFAYADPAHIRSGLTDWESEAVAEFPKDATVIVTSAGAGREVHALAHLGFDVYGFEPNASLVAAGRRVLQNPTRLQVSEWDEFPTFDGHAEAVVIGWGSYMLLAGRARRVTLLQGARRVLEPGGLLLVSYFDRPPTRYFDVVRVIGTLVRHAQRRPSLELGDSLTPNFVHYFTPSEVAAELALAGFDVVSMARTPYGHALARAR